jgi:hypothetical protein
MGCMTGDEFPARTEILPLLYPERFLAHCFQTGCRTRPDSHALPRVVLRLASLPYNISTRILRHAYSHIFHLQTSSQSQSPITTDGQSVSQSWCRAPSGAHDQMFVSVGQFLVCQSGGPSDEGSDLSFVIVFVSLLSIVHKLK